jgi:hypothetical protein
MQQAQHTAKAVLHFGWRVHAAPARFVLLGNPLKDASRTKNV